MKMNPVPNDIIRNGSKKFRQWGKHERKNYLKYLRNLNIPQDWKEIIFSAGILYKSFIIWTTKMQD